MKPIALLRKLLASFLLAATALPAAASSTLYEFGNLLSGSFSPSASFAQLSYTPSGPNSFHFTLASVNMNALFTSGSFIGGIAVNTVANTKASSVTISNFTSSGVNGGISGISAKNGGGPGGNIWDFRFDVGSGGSSDRFGGQQIASWTATFSGAAPIQFADKGFAVHVQGLTSSQGGSAWYSPSSSAPEPEIYAMMLSGMLLVGFATRRRRRTLAS